MPFMQLVQRGSVGVDFAYLLLKGGAMWLVAGRLASSRWIEMALDSQIEAAISALHTGFSVCDCKCRVEVEVRGS